jgi:hypothetical protein
VEEAEQKEQVHLNLAVKAVAVLVLCVTPAMAKMEPPIPAVVVVVATLMMAELVVQVVLALSSSNTPQYLALPWELVLPRQQQLPAHIKSLLSLPVPIQLQ